MNNQMDDQYITWNALVKRVWYALQFLPYQSERNAVGNLSGYLLKRKYLLIPLFTGIIPLKYIQGRDQRN